MRLTTDEQGALVNKTLFPPSTTFDATIESDGSIRLIEVVKSRTVPIVKPRILNGRLRGAEVQLTRDLVAAAIRAERDSR